MWSRAIPLNVARQSQLAPIFARRLVTALRIVNAGENPKAITLRASNAAGQNQNGFLIGGNRLLDSRRQLGWPCALRFLSDLRFF